MLVGIDERPPIRVRDLPDQPIHKIVLLNDIYS